MAVNKINKTKLSFLRQSVNIGQMASAFILSAGLLLPIAFNDGAIAQEFSESHITAAKTAIRATKATAKQDDILPAAAGRLISSLIQSRPDIEAQITQIVNDKAIELAVRRGDLENEVARIYARVFSQEELASINQFFETDTGQKFLNELPVVVREVDGASRVWGTGINRDLAASVRKKLEADGL